MIGELSSFEPFGTGNKAPTFAKRDISIQSFKIIGKNENAVRLEFCDGMDGQLYRGIWFGDARAFEDYILSKAEKKLDIIYSPQINEYKGFRNIQFKIEEYR